ncbi:MAG TPA: hypothetical protein DD381_04715 [Lentisphaeria bacterium]|nr:MAG: hypothetical protein A2X47_01625 [Lentisphaerae bacterium GWF2_38_69]HBM15633.1 hypothetical protein [Lentisphaeria bacterium]
MIILDTCAFLWLISDQSRLSLTASSVIQNNSSKLFVVSVTAWEIAIKSASGKLELADNLSPEETFLMSLLDYNLKEITVNSKIFCRSAALPAIHKDPCDRMIIAAAMEYKCPVITADKMFSRYPGLKVIW